MEFVVILEWIHGSSCDEAEYGWIWADGNDGFSILEILKRIVFYVLLFVGAGIDRYECFRCGGQINVVVQSSKSLWKLKTGVYQLTLVSDKQVFKHWCHFFFFSPPDFMNIKRVYGSILARKITLAGVSSSSPSASISFYILLPRINEIARMFVNFQLDSMARNFQRVNIETFQKFKKSLKILYIRDNENRIERRINRSLL